MSDQKSFPIVGIGASAGGLTAFEAFFSGMPADIEPNMAFVLVQHLAPDHESMLVTLLQRNTKMKVLEVVNGVTVEKNCIYIIPPNHDLALMNGKLQLLYPTSARGQRLSIDFFFRSLAQDQRDRAIGVVLSGTGSDGTAGIRAIKGEGGMVMVQKPESCEFNGMPLSAIATGLVDYQLNPSEMPKQLITYVAHDWSVHSNKIINVLASQSDSDNTLSQIFILLRTQTGHDFSQYKPSTINRRIQRRMAVQHIEELSNYLKLLQQKPDEVEALFRDILIGVTNFFRDPEAFKALEEQVIPKLFIEKVSNGTIRIWSAGCSTGEEAYSLAILIAERMEQIKQSYTIQIFATDIDSKAIAVARAGKYPASIAADISLERLARFFTLDPDENTYCIHKGIRDMLVFSEQDLIKDPPFSKLDLIVCRNVLIYFNTELQEKLVRLFHFALNPAGMLFLGTSEGGGDFSEMFNVTDRKAKLYQRKDNYLLQHTPLGRFLPSLTATKAVQIPNTANRQTFPVKLPLRELTEKALLDQIISAGILVNSHGDILYLHGRSGLYLEPSQGEASVNNILKMAREGLRAGLSTSLHKAVSNNEIVRTQGLRVKNNGKFIMVNLCVRPIPIETLAAPDAPLYLVILEEVLEQNIVNIADGVVGTNVDTEKLIASLEQELRAKDEHLMNVHKELETSTQELKSSNEEMQSVNEELQSTNEELETSKEELQSVNEELTTVNNELNIKVADLSQLNNDMNNLLAGTGIATIFVNHKLNILRFTPTATRIINLISTDVGRPLSDIASNLINYNNLIADTEAVLNTLIPKDIQLQSKAGLWYIMHIMPYRTLENVIEGAVLTFMDITAQKKVEEELEKVNAQSRLAVIVNDSNDAICLYNIDDGKILGWNSRAEILYGWSEAEALAMNLKNRVPEDLQTSELDKLIQLGNGKKIETYFTKRLTKDGKILKAWITSSALRNTTGKIYAIATTERVDGG